MERVKTDFPGEQSGWWWPTGGSSGTSALHMTESTAGKGLWTTSLPVFLPSAFTGRQFGYWMKGIMSSCRRFYNSKCHLRPYFTAHRPNPPPQINPYVLKHPLILHRAEQPQRSLPYCHVTELFCFWSWVQNEGFLNPRTTLTIDSYLLHRCLQNLCSFLQEDIKYKPSYIKIFFSWRDQIT